MRKWKIFSAVCLMTLMLAVTLPALAHEPGCHTGTSPIQYSATEHWSICDECGEEFEKEGHFISCVTGQCRTCGYKGTGTPEHFPAYWEPMQYSATEHWWVCNDCGARINAMEHSIRCDTGLCDTCGHPGTNDVSHDLEGSGGYDAFSHWSASCSRCGKKHDLGSHIISCVTRLCEICGQGGVGEIDHGVTVCYRSETECWTICENCKQEEYRSKHSFQNGACILCGYKQPTATQKPTAAPKPTTAPKPTAAPKPTTAPKPTAVPKAEQYAADAKCIDNGDGTHDVVLANGDRQTKRCEWLEAALRGRACEVCGVCGATRLQIGTAGGRQTDVPAALQEAIILALTNRMDETRLTEATAKPAARAQTPEGAQLIVRERKTLVGGNGETVKVYVVSYAGDGEMARHSGMLMLRLPCQMNGDVLEGYRLMRLTADGDMIELPFMTGDGSLIFTTEELGVFALIPMP